MNNNEEQYTTASYPYEGGIDEVPYRTETPPPRTENSELIAKVKE